MALRDGFGQLCEQVCERQGWELVPAGVRMSFANGRRQIVALEFFEFEEQELVRFYTEIGSVERMSPERLSMALQINARLAHGALAVRDGGLIMTDTLLLKDADASEIEASLSYLGETADYYEKTLFGTDSH